jgi:undecaprenyl diphosphate synthase
MKASPIQATAHGQDKCPAHVAIIMDGNGRWAKARSLPRVAGHKKGADALREIMNGCRDAGVSHLTIYAFSSENWKRPAVEVKDLMELLRHYLGREIATLHKNGIRLRIIGDKTKLAADICKQIDDAEKLTEHNTAFHFNVALSYGARQELTQAMQTLATRIAAGGIKPEEVDENTISSFLYTSGIPDPDLLIRTGGEHRLSNFLLWQSAYTELYFTPTLWPDFSISHLQEALAEYANRERRYGNTAG